MDKEEGKNTDKPQEQQKSGFPVSIILIWAITVFAVLLSLLALAGLIITKHKKSKNAFLKKIEEVSGVKIGDIGIKLFPLVKNFEIKLEKVKFEDGEIKKVVIKPEKIEVFSPHITISTEKKGSGKIKIPDMCSVKHKISRIPTVFFPDITAKIHDFKVVVSDILSIEGNLNAQMKNGKAEINSTFLTKLKDENIRGELLIKSNIKSLEGNVEINTTEEVISSKTKLSFGFCKLENTLKEIEVKGISNISFELSKIHEIAGKIVEGSRGAKITGKAGAVIKANFRITGNKPYLDVKMDSKIADFKLKNGDKTIFYTPWLKLSYFAGYDGKSIKGGGEIESEKGIEKLSFTGTFSPDEKKGKVNVMANLDLSVIEGLAGKFNVSGDLEIPKVKGVFLGSADMLKIESIGGEKLFGEFEINEEKITFRTIISQGISNIRWNGEYNISEGKLKSSLSLAGARVSDMLDILGVSLDIQGVATGKIKMKNRKDIIYFRGKLNTSQNRIFGEKIDCIFANLRTKVKTGSGKFHVEIAGRGLDGILTEEIKNCKLALRKGIPSSYLSFRTEVMKTGFEINLAGKYNLRELDILPLKIKGESEFSGEIGGSFKKFSGKIKLDTGRVELVDFPVVSSCVGGEIIITRENLEFSGELCEGFQTYAVYSPKKKNTFMTMKKDSTEIRFINGKLEGEGKLSTISSIVPSLVGIDGDFSLSYDIVRRVGKVKVVSDSFRMSRFDIKSFSFISDIKRGNLDFLAKGIYNGEEITAEGVLNTSSKKISAEIKFGNFAGIPMDGRIRVIGQLTNPTIIGNIKIRNVVFSPEVIERVRREIGMSSDRKTVLVETREGEILKKEEFLHVAEIDEKTTFSPNFNMIISFEDSVYETGILTVVFSGRINISGEGKEIKSFGVFKIKDGVFTFAGIDFKGISGFAFLKEDDIFVNISAHTEVITFENETYRIKAKVVGNIKSPNVYLSSSPSLSESDIVCVIALLRKCESIDDFESVVEGMLYRNISIIATRIEKELGIKSGIKPKISPSEVGITGKIGELYFSLSQNFIEDVNKFSLMRYINQNTSLMLTWDDKKYGYSILGNMGNIGMDIKLIKRF